MGYPRGGRFRSADHSGRIDNFRLYDDCEGRFHANPPGETQCRQEEQQSGLVPGGFSPGRLLHAGHKLPGKELSGLVAFRHIKSGFCHFTVS